MWLQVVEDDFDGLYKRASFYKLLENGEIYDWLVEIHNSTSPVGIDKMNLKSSA